jgi:hypothetical protein
VGCWSSSAHIRRQRRGSDGWRRFRERWDTYDEFGMPETVVSVDFSNAYSKSERIFSRNVVRVNVDGETTVGQVKATVLGYLSIPYLDLYLLRLKDRDLQDEEKVLELGLSERSVLVLACRNFEELYERMRRDRRL